jgi:predicted permease
MDIIKALPNAKPRRQCMSSPAMLTAASSNALLHLRDVKFDMALHLHVLFASTLHFVLDLLFEINHLKENVSMITANA